LGNSDLIIFCVFCSGVNPILIPFIVASKPEISFEKTGEIYTATTITPIKTSVVKFTPGETKDSDIFGFGTSFKVISLLDKTFLVTI
jgi:hypothetical protein